MAGLIAPKPMVVIAGRNDNTFPLNGVLDAYGTAEKIYEHLGCKQNISLIIGDEGHRFYPELAWSKFMEYVK